MRRWTQIKVKMGCAILVDLFALIKVTIVGEYAMYHAAAVVVLLLHLSFILWVIFGALLTRGRPLLTRLHVASVIWGLLIETFPWTCPLTYAEDWLNARSGIAPYERGFLLHYLDALIYPNMPSWVLTVAAVLVVAVNGAIYWNRWRRQ